VLQEDAFVSGEEKALARSASIYRAMWLLAFFGFRRSE
jgi:hypothetical protein